MRLSRVLEGQQQISEDAVLRASWPLLRASATEAAYHHCQLRIHKAQVNSLTAWLRPDTGSERSVSFSSADNQCDLVSNIYVVEKYVSVM